MSDGRAFVQSDPLPELVPRKRCISRLAPGGSGSGIGLSSFAPRIQQISRELHPGGSEDGNMPRARKAKRKSMRLSHTRNIENDNAGAPADVQRAFVKEPLLLEHTGSVGRNAQAV